MQKPVTDAKPAPLALDPSAFQIANPEEFARNMLRLMEEGGKVMSGMMEKSGGGGKPANMAGEMQDATKLMAEIAQHWMTDPARLAQTQGELMRGYAELWTNTIQRMMGRDVAPVATPEALQPANRRQERHLVGGGDAILQRHQYGPLVAVEFADGFRQRPARIGREVEVRQPVQGMSP